MYMTINPRNKNEMGFLTPSKVINIIGLEPGNIVIDFGCGSGFWALPMAKIVGQKGLILAVDPYEENLRVLKDNAAREGVSNIRYFRAPYSSPNIPLTERADLILISNILSLVSTDKDLVASLKKNARLGTKLVIIDWNKDSSIGPKEKDRINVEDLMLVAEKGGFQFKKLLPCGEHHTGMFFVYIGK